MENLDALLANNWEIHYGYITGTLHLQKGVKTITTKNWPEHHELMTQFLKLRKEEKIRVKEKRYQLDVYSLTK